MKDILKKVSFIVVIVIIVYTVNLYLEFQSKEYLMTLHRLEQIEEIPIGFVYFGRNSCNNCLYFLPILTSVAEEENVLVYYFNLDNFRAQSEITEEQIQVILKKYNVKSIPYLLKLENSKIAGVFDIDNINTSVGLKESIRSFIVDEKTQSKYIPQYGVMIVLFCLSILMTSLIFIFSQVLRYKNVKFVILTFNIGIIILSFLTYISILKSLDLAFVDIGIQICRILTLISNIYLICAVFVMNYKEKHPEVIERDKKKPNDFLK